MSKKFPWRFTRKTGNISIAPLPTHTPQVEMLNKWYRSINHLPLSRFIDAIVDDNIYSLIISGKPTDQQLYNAWSDILSEYSDAIGDQETKLYNTLFKELTILKSTLSHIEELIDILGKIYYEPFTKQLNELTGTSYVFDWEKPEEYKKQLRSCFNRSRSIKMDIHFKQAHFDAIQAKNKDKSQKYTREYFQSVLISISDYVKYPITDAITVFEYCERIKRFTAYCEQMKKHG